MLRRSLCFALTLALSALAFIAPARAAGSGSILVSGNISASCATYTGCPTGTFLSTTISVPANVAVQVAGTFSGTLQFEGSLDCANGNTVPLFAVGASVAQATTTSPGLFSNTVTNINCFQVRATSWTSGTATVTILVTNTSVSASSQSTVTTVQPNGGVMAVAGQGTAGSASGGVLTVQGQTGMTPLQVTNNCSSGCIPQAYTYFNVPASTTCSAAVCVIKATGGAFVSLINLSTSAQSSQTCTFYDNASAASGQILFAEFAMGAGQTITFGGGQGIKTVNGLTLQCTGAPTGNGMLVLFQ